MYIKNREKAAITTQTQQKNLETCHLSMGALTTNIKRIQNLLSPPKNFFGGMMFCDKVPFVSPEGKNSM